MKSATQQFIEDAIAGGWLSANVAKHLSTDQVLLDPLAWQAVGKTRGWQSHNVESVKGQGWWRKMHDFIDHLADGRTIEDALTAIAV